MQDDSSTAEKSTLAFTTADIDHSKARTDRQYFVRVIKDPFLRFLLRTRIIKEPPASAPVSAPAPRPQPVLQAQPSTAALRPAPRPQLRMSIRISSFVMMKRKSEKSSTIANIVLSVLLFFALCAILYLMFFRA